MSKSSDTPDVIEEEILVDPLSSTNEKTKKKFRCVRHVSFVDCPGHDILMATMLNGA